MENKKKVQDLVDLLITHTKNSSQLLKEILEVTPPITVTPSSLEEGGKLLKRVIREDVIINIFALTDEIRTPSDIVVLIWMARENFPAECFKVTIVIDSKK